MQVGERLLALPQQLEPYADADTLTLLHGSLRPTTPPGAPAPAAGAAEEAAIGWLHAVAHATVGALLEAVAGLAAFSPLGAKQLAADVAYLANILSGGLGLPHIDELAQLEALLTCAPAELPERVRMSRALPPGLASAIASKRGLTWGPEAEKRE